MNRVLCLKCLDLGFNMQNQICQECGYNAEKELKQMFKSNLDFISRHQCACFVFQSRDYICRDCNNASIIQRAYRHYTSKMLNKKNKPRVFYQMLINNIDV